MYILIYKKKFILIMNYRKHEGLILERLLEIMKKVLQLKKIAKKVIWKSQTKLDKKFEEIKTYVFKKEFSMVFW